jgi:hypothetical protein
MTSVSTSSPGRSSESPSPPPKANQNLPRKNSFNPFIAQIVAKAPTQGRMRPRSEKLEHSSEDSSGGTRSLAANGSISKPSGEYDEHGLSLPDDVAHVYHIERVARAARNANNARQIASSLDPNTGKFSDAKFIEICMLGVPSEYRRAVWLACTGIEVQMHTHKQRYRELRARLREDPAGAVPDKVLEQIDKDITRTLRVNIRKDKHSLMRKMRRVCILYAMYNPHIAYSQGFNFMIMSLLILKFTVEEAFWMLDHITTKLFPLSWDTCLTGLHADSTAFAYYFSKTFPLLSEHIQGSEVTFEMIFLHEAFATLLLEKMPHESAWCLWDRMFAGGAIEFFNGLLRIVEYVVSKIPTKVVTETPPPPLPVKKKSSFLGRLRLVPEIDMTALTNSSSSSPPKSRVEFDIDANELKTFFSVHVRRIVDMPQVLAMKSRQQISPLSLEMRRNRLRMDILSTEHKNQQDRLGSSSTDSSD